MFREKDEWIGRGHSNLKELENKVAHKDKIRVGFKVKFSNHQNGVMMIFKMLWQGFSKFTMPRSGLVQRHS